MICEQADVVESSGAEIFDRLLASSDLERLLVSRSSLVLQAIAALVLRMFRLRVAPRTDSTAVCIVEGGKRRYNEWLLNRY